MSDTLFTDATSTTPGTTIVSSWLNDVNTATYDRLTSVAGTNTITATGPTSMTAYAAGQNFYIVPAASNTGAVTLNINGLGAKNVTKYGTTALVAGDMLINGVYEVSYDGTQFQLINPSTFNLSQVVPITNGGTGATTASQALINLGAIGRLIAVQVFTASGTYTPTAGMNSVIVEAIGGGGGGGGAVVTGAGQLSGGTGGGGGAYTRGRFTSPGTQTVTIGAKGIGVTGSNGTAGTATSFGALLTAPGGGGGQASPASTILVVVGGTAAALGTGGNISASRGKHGGYLATGAAFGAPGADGPWGGGAPINGANADGISVAATDYGAGGGGSANNASQVTTRKGGDGGGGLLIVYEYS